MIGVKYAQKILSQGVIFAQKVNKLKKYTMIELLTKGFNKNDSIK